MDDLGDRKRRLRMDAGRRGYLEVELVMRPFLEGNLAALSADEVGQLEGLARLEDLELWEVICGRAAPPPGVEPALLQRIRRSARGRGGGRAD